MVLRLRGGGTFVDVMYKGRKKWVLLAGTEDIHYVKESLANSLGIPTDRQILSYEGEILDDGKLPHHSHFIPHLHNLGLRT